MMNQVGFEQNRKSHYKKIYPACSMPLQSTLGEDAMAPSKLTPEKLVKALALFGGRWSQADALSRLAQCRVEEVAEVARSREDIFSVIKEDTGMVIELAPKVILCTDYLSEKGCLSPDSCNNLHFCKVYMTGFCEMGSCCEYGHRLDTQHNRSVLSKFCLQFIDKSVSMKVIKKVCRGSASPQICGFYNSSRGCRENDKCSSFHICRDYVMGNGECLLPACSFNHNILTDHCTRLLNRCQISTTETPHNIVSNLKLSIQNQDDGDSLPEGTASDASSTDESSEEDSSTGSESSDASDSEEDSSTGSESSNASDSEEDSSTGSESSDVSDSEDTEEECSMEPRTSDASNSLAENTVERYSPIYAPCLSTDQCSLPSHWVSMGPNETHSLHLVPPESKEYKEVSSRLLLSLPKVVIHKIQRLQNPYLWYLLKNKIEDFSRRYDVNQLNIQKLFHGVDPSKIDTICKENIEWRQSCVGEEDLGNGAYFSNSAAVARRQCAYDANRNCFLILADVIIGSIVEGRADLTPAPSSMGASLTYVNDANAPTIFVKHSKEEYYPQYILEFC
ncbi:protein mono-ADP-ribosyltransferase PARP12 [Procambarus clarkii]|uniref:protein mono-ADP-ribosyltransferase PARP12 n=1 Tax=Procambarus clarkii TaxID=6728 RepID=UPI003742B2E6